MRTLHTHSGSIYLVDEENMRVARKNPDYTKRGDEEWLNYHYPLPRRSLVGHSVVFILDSLADRGPDDNGTAAEDASRFTTRTTSPVLIDSFDEPGTNHKEP